MYLKNYNVYILPKIQIALALALSIWIFIPISLSVKISKLLVKLISKVSICVQHVSCEKHLHCKSLAYRLEPDRVIDTTGHK